MCWDDDHSCYMVTFMSLFDNLKKKFTNFVEWIFLDPNSERSHLEFQREVRKYKREKAAASTAGDKR